MRDLLLGGTPFDLDLVVEGDAAAVAASLGGELKAFDRFGTATVVLDGFSYDIAQARRETYAQPGALPDVEPAPLAEDLLRRDFTVNAIALALAGDSAGELTAAPAALEDLDARRLRVLHDRSFIDDPTRLMRLARYASRLGFEVEPHTRELADAAVAGGALWTVSGSRLGAELRLLARERDPVAALRGLADLGLDRAIHPEFGIEDEELARRALALLPDDGRRDRLAVALAARRVPPAELGALLESLAFEGRRPRRDPARCHARRRRRPRRWRRRARRRRSRRRWRARHPSSWRSRERSARLRRPASGSTRSATSAWRSTEATCSPRACPRARRSGAGCARRWRRSSIGGRPGASRSSPPR